MASPIMAISATKAMMMANLTRASRKPTSMINCLSSATTKRISAMTAPPRPSAASIDMKVTSYLFSLNIKSHAYPSRSQAVLYLPRLKPGRPYLSWRHLRHKLARAKPVVHQRITRNHRGWRTVNIKKAHFLAPAMTFQIIKQDVCAQDDQSNRQRPPHGKLQTQQSM